MNKNAFDCNVVCSHAVFCDATRRAIALYYVLRPGETVHVSCQSSKVRITFVLTRGYWTSCVWHYFRRVFTWFLRFYLNIYYLFIKFKTRCCVIRIILFPLSNLACIWFESVKCLNLFYKTVVGKTQGTCDLRNQYKRNPTAQE